MNIRKYIILVLLCLVSVAAGAQNTLSVAALTGGQGKNVMIPISMDNVDEVVAVQFNIQLPFSKTSGAQPTLTDSRNINGHTITTKALGSNRYTVVIANLSNKPIGGSGGTLVNFPMTVPTGLDPQTVHAITLSDVVIANRKGDNVQTGATNGSYTIQRESSPDLEVSDVALSASTLVPGQTATVTWKVANVGDADTKSGWMEKVYLVSTSTEEAVSIGNVYFNNTLLKGGYTARSATFTLSETIGLEGEVTAKVVVEPNSSTGEYAADRLNNTATGGTADLQKRLFLTVPATTVKEGQTLRLTLKRSGDRSLDETFAVSTSLADHVTVPSSVTIRSGQSAASFDVTVPDNNVVNTYQEATVTVAKANGYPDDMTATISIEDNELLPLTVKLDKSEYNEGETIKATVSVPYRIEGEDLKLSFSIEKSKRFRLPQSYTFEAGATTAVIEIPIVQDNTPANDETIQLNVSADHHMPASTLFILHDDDVPAIEMTLQPKTVSEGAGYNAVYATVKRTSATNSKITLKLSDDGAGDLYYSSTITMDAGVEEATFPIGVKDNQKVDGTRKIKFTAAVYITDCGCSAIGDKQTAVSDTITINDNDGPTLSIVSNKTTILEGDAQGATLTVSRNDDTSAPLTVTLSTTATDVAYAKTVTIPAGSASVTTTFAALSNDESEGNRTLSVVASAEGYSPGSVWMLISDQTLPDAEMQKPVAATEVEAGSMVSVELTVKNIGAKELPASTPIKLTIGSTTTILQTEKAIPAGGTYTVTGQLTAPSVPGNYTITAKINPEGIITELQTLNNTAVTDIKVTTAYAYTIASEKDKYLMGDEVVLSGTVKNNSGTAATDSKVEAYVIYAGSRTTLSATSDKSGNFSVTYTIPAGMGGEFSYGVCMPGEGLTTTNGSFKVYGLSRKTTSYITNKLYLNEPYEGTIELKNMSDLDLHNVKANCADPGNYTITFTGVSLLSGNGSAEIKYVILPTALSEGNDWDRLSFSITTDEGASLDVMTYNYTQEHTPTLVVETNSINTTVTKGKSRLYPIVITNTGLAETGKITVDLPQALSSFVSLATPSTMPSMATGDSATVMLRFNAADFDVNIIQKGTIAINCEKGDGKQVNFNVKVVSDEQGSLRVKVQDENTIYGNKDGEHPYVSGATVKLTDYNTGALVMSDVTGDDGSLLFENINEGYYHISVTAPKHDSYNQNVLVSPGTTTEHLATISYQAISVTWEVEETEVEDEYEIVTKVTYETQVPVPVVEITAPDTLCLEEIDYGKSTLMNVILRNRGLIAAENVQYTPPTAKGYVFQPMVEYSGFSLSPEQSYVIPILVMHEEDYNDANFARNIKRTVVQPKDADSGTECSGKMNTQYSWICGPDSKYASIVKAINWAMKNTPCSKASGNSGTVFVNVSTGIGSGPGFIGTAGTYTAGTGGKANTAALQKLACSICECFCPDPLMEFTEDAINGYVSNKTGGAIKMVPCIGPAISAIFDENRSVTKFAGDCVGDVIGKIPQTKMAAGLACMAYNAVRPMIEDALGLNSARTRQGQSAMTKAETTTGKLPALLQSSGLKQCIFMTYFTSFRDENIQVTGAPEAMNSADVYTELTHSLSDIDYALSLMRDDGDLWDFDLNTIPETTTVSDKSEGMGAYLTSLMPNKRANVYDFSLRSYVERVRNFWRNKAGMEYDSDNIIDTDSIASIKELRDLCIKAMVNFGCADMEELMYSARKDWLQYQETASENTCAEVKLEISQKLVLTRQAFRGTLTIDNSSGSNLSEILVNVNATNMGTGELSTSHEMQINVESIEGFSGNKDGEWSLDAGKKGVATFLFIPTKYAAPDTLTTYSFGGTLSFNDGSTVQNRSLYPVSLQVKPSPELDLTYFMQRDIYGDNPLTTDIVEPVVPAEFSVLIHNKGNGDANNVRMLTQQPKIVENEKGLAVDFAIVSSSLNGGEKAMSLSGEIATEFGTIGAGKSSYATWGLTSSLLGHFTDYDVSVTHVTDYGNPDLTLLDKVTIHELIHSVNAKIGDTTYRAWITNDVADSKDEPDHIYLSNGTDEDLVALSDATEIVSLGNSRYRISVTVPQKEWFYTSVANPAGKYSNIIGITNEDTGEALDAENFWTTDYTMRDGIDPMLDYRLHIADLSTAPGTRHYVVEFEPMPEVRLDVEKIESVPADDQIAEAPITELTVTFNKDINTTTFTRDDIQLRHEGKVQTTDLPISQAEGSGRIFKIDTQRLTDNGFYVLQVRTDSIKDTEGFYGAEGKQVRWMLFKDGLVHYNIAIYPSADYGSVSIASDATDVTGKSVAMLKGETTGTVTGTKAYGSTIVMTAVPTAGHKFSYWKDNATGQILSYDASYETEARNTLNISAVFALEAYKVTVTCNTDEGTVDAASGIYDYGTAIVLDAQPTDGYQLSGYRINDTFVETTEPYTLTVEGQTAIDVVFREISPSVLLDESRDYMPESLESAKVTLYRTFYKNEWNTICLPCAVPHPEEVFGKGTEVARLTAFDGKMLRFNTVTSMEANVPYLIKPTTINSYLSTDAPTVLYTLGTTKIEQPDGDTPEDRQSGITFVGTYSPVFMPGNDGNYYIAYNKFYLVDTDDISIGRFRGYFHASGISLSMLSLGVDETTYIQDTTITDEDGDVYNLNGVMVRKKGEPLTGLKPGIYITRNKKFVVK